MDLSISNVTIFRGFDDGDGLENGKGTNGPIVEIEVMHGVVPMLSEEEVMKIKLEAHQPYPSIAHAPLFLLFLGCYSTCSSTSFSTLQQVRSGKILSRVMQIIKSPKE